MITQTDETTVAEEEIWNVLLAAYRTLKKNKPTERSEKARRFAVCLTELEKVMSYYLVMISNDDFEG